MTDTLAGDFPPVSRDQWLDEVRRVLLKGKPDATDEDFVKAFDSRLVSRTDDGIEIQPLYTADDAPASLPEPGQAPFLRSTHAAPTPWEIRQRVWPSVRGSSAVTELESGTTGILVTITDTDHDADTFFADALGGVLLDLAPVHLQVTDPRAQVAAARGLMNAWEKAAVAAPVRRGTLGLDPIGAYATSGGAIDLDALLSDATGVVVDIAESAPSARAIVIDGTVWHDAGASEAQELAWTMAAAVWTVRALVNEGVSLAQAVATLEFRLSATDDQFLTIAKLRAARVLWARVAEAAGLPEAQRAMHLHVEGSRAMLTRYDTWVNALRSTVACFAAAVGGADAITVLPHDVLIEEGGSSLGRRVARNTQTILQMESHLARVIDPAGGSWYVESLTSQLADRAWALVQDSERAGGIVAMLQSGRIQELLAEQRDQRKARLATRKQPLTGLSEFPDMTQTPPPAAGTSAAQASAAPAQTPFEPVTLHRLADDYEAERGRADAQAAHGERPVVFLAALGTPAQSTARVTFAKNLFEAAGIRTQLGGVEEFAGSGATVACLCSADSVYAEQGEQAAAQLRADGATRIYLAGRGANVPGVDEEVGMGSNVLDFLTRALDELGVAR